MARYSKHDIRNIYPIADKWKATYLLGGKSLLWPDKDVWSQQKLEAFSLAP